MSDQDLETEATLADEQNLADEAGMLASGSDDGGAGKKTLGLERWVQLGFVAAALMLVWLSGHVISSVWYVFADPSESIVTFASVIVGILSAILLYKHATVNTLSHEVADELSKVTWPTRQETSSSTVVVIVTSLIAALFLGFFDTIWSWVTDLVYKV